MATVEVKAWKCEFGTCGHVWLSADGREPLRCAKCKRPGWNGRKMIHVSEVAEVPRALVEAMAKQPVRESPVGFVASVRKHDPKTCTVYKCGMCAVAKGG